MVIISIRTKKFTAWSIEKQDSTPLLCKIIQDSLVLRAHPLNSGGCLRDVNMRFLEQNDAVQDSGRVLGPEVTIHYSSPL